jgi:hypothetical protein
MLKTTWKKKWPKDVHAGSYLVCNASESNCKACYISHTQSEDTTFNNLWGCDPLPGHCSQNIQ